MSAFEQPPRLVPDSPLPPYAYVTGRFPHPTSDRAGHSYGHTAEAPPPVDPHAPGQSRPLLVGCDLFNHGYYWEAHEVWEGLWHASGRRGPVADALKGLIKLAAAGVKAREGRPAGVARHAARAAELFTRVRGEIGRPEYLGFDLDALVATANELAHHPVVAASDAPVEIVFGFQLIPRVRGA